MRLPLLCGLLTIALTGVAVEAQHPPGRYIPTGPNGYIYEAPQGWSSPPPYGYVYDPWEWRSPRRLQPMGFGSPYYNGYNDPYYHSYGPGVREFIDFGGADFYGW